jgi:hypothetical protein
VRSVSRETTLFKYIAYDGAFYRSGIKDALVWNIAVKSVSPTSPDFINRIIADASSNRIDLTNDGWLPSIVAMR